MVLPVNPEILWGHHLPPALPLSSRTENAHSRSQDAPRESLRQEHSLLKSLLTCHSSERPSSHAHLM